MSFRGSWLIKGGSFMDARDLLELKIWGDFCLNPSGDQVFFVESEFDEKTNQVCSHINHWEWHDGWISRGRFTAGPKDVCPRVSPDGRWLGFLRSSKGGQRQLWVMSTSGGEAQQMTWLVYGIKDFAWHPQDFRVALIAPLNHGLVEVETDASSEDLYAKFNRDVRTLDRQYYKLDGTGIFGPELDQLLTLNMSSNRLEVLSGGTLSYGAPQYSSDGEKLYYLRTNPEVLGQHPGERDLWAYQESSGFHHRLTEWHWQVEDYRVSPDQAGIALVINKPEDLGYGQTELWYLFGGERKPLSQDVDRPIGDGPGTDVPVAGPTRPVFSEDARVVWSLVTSEGTAQLWQFAVDGTGGRPMTSGQHVIYGFDYQGGRWLLGIADPTHPSGLASVEDDFHLNIEWTPLPWNDVSVPTPEEIWAKNSDGTVVQTWILKPTGARVGSAPYPVILEIHGGPMSLYGWRYYFEFHWLTAHGYAVVFSNPRGSIGYGHDFCAQIMGKWGDRDYADVMAALDAALNHDPELDATRLGVAGGSYGGFMVNWILGHTQRFQAAITMRSVVNRFSAMGSSDLGWLRVPQYGTRPWWEEPKPYWEQSPLKYVSNIKTPLLIEHQSEDQRLPIEQGEQLYSALKYLGRPVRMVIYPGESHGMSRGGKPWHRIHRLRTHAAWWRKYLLTDTNPHSGG